MHCLGLCLLLPRRGRHGSRSICRCACCCCGLCCGSIRHQRRAIIQIHRVGSTSRSPGAAIFQPSWSIPIFRADTLYFLAACVVKAVRPLRLHHGGLVWGRGRLDRKISFLWVH